jgi:hypothetical protein
MGTKKELIGSFTSNSKNEYIKNEEYLEKTYHHFENCRKFNKYSTNINIFTFCFSSVIVPFLNRQKNRKIKDQKGSSYGKILNGTEADDTDRTLQN